MHAQDRDLRVVHERRGEEPALRTRRRHRERATREVLELELLVARRGGEALDLLRQRVQAEPVGAAHDGDGEPVVRCGRDGDVVVPLEHDLLRRVVQARVEHRILAQRGDERAHDVGHVGELHAGGLRCRRRLRAVCDNGREIGLGDKRELRHGACGVRHVLGNALAQAGERNALLVGVSRARLRGRWRGGGAAQGGALHVVERDPATRPAARDRREVNAVLLRGLARGRDGLDAARRIGDGRQGRHGSRGSVRARRARRMRCDGRLPRHLDLDEHVAHGHGRALRGAEAHDDARARRRNLDRRLVGQHLDQRLVLDHDVTDGDAPGDDLRLGDALSDVRQLELECHGGPRRYA